MSKKKKSTLLAIIFSVLVYGFLGLILLAIFQEALIRLIWALVTGWFTHLIRVLPRLDWNPELIFCFLLALGLSTWMFHRFLNWLHQQGTLRQAWTAKRTLALTSLLLMLFGMSVAMTGIIHQSIWVMKGKVFQNSGSLSELTNSIGKAKNLYVACFHYASDHNGIFPQAVDRTALINDGYITPENQLFSYQPQNKSLPPEPWVYYPRKTTDNPNLILLHSSSAAFNGKWIVAKLDGSVQAVSEEEFQKFLAFSRKHDRGQSLQNSSSY